MKIEALNIFPVKSLAGISVTHAEVSAYGFKHDRQWMLVDENGKFLSQRKLPQMATISVDMKTNSEITAISLSKKGFGQIELETDPKLSQDVHIWNDNCTAQCATKECNQWINDVLNINNAKLVLFVPDNMRQPGQLDRFGINSRHFSDEAPLLLTNIESLKALNLHLNESSIDPVDMRHFRSNIIVSGIEAFSEHHFDHMIVNRNTAKVASKETHNSNQTTVHFRMVDHCQRCSIITVDPDSGNYRKKGTPLTQLAQINPMPNKPKAPAFGVNLCLNQQEHPFQSQGFSKTMILSVGQRIEFL